MGLKVTSENFVNTRLALLPGQDLFFHRITRTFEVLNTNADPNKTRQWRTISLQVRTCVREIPFASLTSIQKLNVHTNIQTYNQLCLRYNRTIDNSCLWRIVNCIVRLITCGKLQLKYRPIALPSWDPKSLMVRDSEGLYDYENYGELIPYFETASVGIEPFVPLIRNLLAASTPLILASEPTRKTQLLIIANEEARHSPVSAVESFWEGTPDIIMALYHHLLSVPQIDSLLNVQGCLHRAFLKIEPKTLNEESLKRYLALMGALSTLPEPKTGWHREVISNVSLMIEFLDAILSLPSVLLKENSDYISQVTRHMFSKVEQEKDVLDLLKYCAGFLPQGIKEYGTEIQGLITKAIPLAKKMKAEDQKRLLESLSLLKEKGIAADAYMNANRQIFLELFVELRKAKIACAQEFELVLLERGCDTVKDLNEEETKLFYELLLMRENGKKDFFLFRKVNPVANSRFILFNLMEFLATQTKLSDDDLFRRTIPFFERVKDVRDVADGPNKKNNMTYKEKEKLLVCADRVARKWCPDPTRYGRLTAFLGAERVVSLTTYLSNNQGVIKICNAIATQLLFAVLVEEVKVKDAEVARLLLQELNLSQLDAIEFNWLITKKIFTDNRDRYVGHAKLEQLTVIYGELEKDLEVNFRHVAKTLGEELAIPELPEADQKMRLSDLGLLFESVRAQAEKGDAVEEIQLNLDALVKRITQQTLQYAPVAAVERAKGYRNIELYIKHGIIASRTRPPAMTYNQLKALSRSSGLCFGGVKPAAADFYYQTTGREQRVSADSIEGGVIALFRIMRKGIFMKHVAAFCLDYAKKAKVSQTVDVHDLHDAMKTVGKRFNVEGWESFTEEDAAPGKVFREKEVQEQLLLCCIGDYTGHAIVNFFHQAVYGLPGSPQIITGELKILIHDWFKEHMPKGEKDPYLFQCKVLQMDPVMSTGVGRMKREYAIYFLTKNGILPPKKSWFSQKFDTKLTPKQIAMML